MELKGRPHSKNPTRGGYTDEGTTEEVPPTLFRIDYL
jgi:hypothetical protein